MKLLAALFVLFSMHSAAQPVAKIPAGAEAFYNKAMPAIKLEYKALVTKSAIALRNRPVNVDSLENAFKSNPLLSGLTPLDITALMQLVLTQNAKDAEADMQADMQTTQTVNKMRQQQRDLPGANAAQKAKLDSIRKLQQSSMSALAASDSKKMKMEYDRSVKAMSALANMVQKTSSTQDAIISNLK